MAQYKIVTVPDNEVVTAEMAETMVRRDYCAFVKEDSRDEYTVDQFVGDALLPYWIVTNTWALMVRDVAGTGAELALLLQLEQIGLRDSIVMCSKAADILVRAYHEGVEIPVSSLSSSRFVQEAAKLEPKNSLQVLRYAKRFAPRVPTKVSKLHEDAELAFTALQRDMKDASERLHSLPPGAMEILSVARDVLQDVIGEFPGFKDEAFPRFGPGAVRNCNNSVLEKYKHLVAYGAYTPSKAFNLSDVVRDGNQVHPDLEMKTRKHPTKGKRMSNLFRPHLGGWGLVPQVTRFSSVPKKVDTDRGIALEDPINMSNQLYVKDLLEERIANHRWGYAMPIKEQDRNRELARKGALYNTLATIDYSSASDTVTKDLVQMLFPDSWWRAFMRCVPTGFILSEHDFGPRKLFSFATMGCGCTFVVETLTFFAIDAAADIVMQLHAGWHPDGYNIREIQISDAISAMGDDQTCPTYLLPLISYIGEQVGFRINHNKTFTNGLYRESCGAEWLKHGTNCVSDVTSEYYPRIPINGSWEEYTQKVYRQWRDDDSETGTGMTKLIALQRKLASFAPSAADFLSKAIRSYAPFITSGPSEDVNDLFSANEQVIEAFFVGGTVPSFYRKSGFVTLPEGYVAKDKISEFLFSAADELQRKQMFTLLTNSNKEHRTLAECWWPCYRQFRVEFTVRAIEANKEELCKESIVEALRLERWLNADSKAKGFPDIHICSQTGCYTTNLAETVGIRPYESSWDGLIGGTEVRLRFISI